MNAPHTIGVVMDFFRPGIIDGAGAYTRENGLRLDARWAVRADWMPEKPDWDGVLAHFTDMETIFHKVMGLGLPVVHLSGWLGGAALPRVQHDFAACAALAVKEFGSLGIERVAGLDLSKESIDLRSLRGLQVALKRGGMKFERLSSWRVKGMANQARNLAVEMEGIERPFGLFMVHAGLAWSLVDELVRRGTRVPEDVAIIVIDKDAQQSCALAPVPLTAVTLDDWQQGYDAAATIHRMIRGEADLQKIRRISPAGLTRRESTGIRTNRDPVVAKAQHLIESHPAGHLTVDDLASRVGVSRRNFEQRFKLATGTTPHSAILLRRITQARHLLSVGRSSVSDVAEACGFSSVHYFSTAFKRETGQAPGGYRKLSRERKRSD